MMPIFGLGDGSRRAREQEQKEAAAELLADAREFRRRSVPLWRRVFYAVNWRAAARAAGVVGGALLLGYLLLGATK